ncbi:hypothetical protein ABR738_01160 [Streptomyces sp. Edi4]|uniref:hypothetical protein n=1 Tax=Streptomyces sp. Edi4 TaxID=3162527 RepID=UPI00330561DB
MRHNGRPALLATEIPPQNLNLRDDEHKSIVCPDCDRWHPLYRMMIKTHHLDRESRGGRAPRCPGSAQRIKMNMTVEEWGAKLLDAERVAVSRRSAQQFYKPLPSAPVPVSRMAHAPKAESVPYFQNELNTAHRKAREALVLHRATCEACQADRFCGTGRQLEERNTWTAETREQQREKQAREQQADQNWERRQAKQLPIKRATEWKALASKAAGADSLRAQRPAGKAPSAGPVVPLEPQDPAAHAARQAELGEMYAARHKQAKPAA